MSFSNIEESLFERARLSSVRAPRVNHLSLRNLQRALAGVGVVGGITFAFAAMGASSAHQNSARSAQPAATVPSSSMNGAAEHSQPAKFVDSTV